MTITDFRPDYTSASVTAPGGPAPGWSFAEMLSDERPETVVRITAPEPMPAVRERNLRGAFADLMRIAARPPGWDGGGGQRLSTDALVSAAQLVVHLSRYDDLVPHLVPLPTGGVQLEWHVAGSSLEIEVDRRGRAHFLAITAGGDVTLDAEPIPGRFEFELQRAQRVLDDLAALLRSAR